MEDILGLRKVLITLVVMIIATVTLYTGSIDQDTFKWLMSASGVAYLAANTVSKKYNQE